MMLAQTNIKRFAYFMWLKHGKYLQMHEYTVQSFTYINTTLYLAAIPF